MTKESAFKASIFILFALFFTVLGYRIKDSYEARVRAWKDQIIVEAIASGDLIRTESIRESGLCKASKYAMR